ncbi:MAG: gliding motility lipoprotein GldD [Bacteroidota bacterium]
MAILQRILINRTMLRNQIFKPVLIIFAALFLVTFISCDHHNSAPLPKGYVRIALPEKEYRSFDTIFPYAFDYPVYGKVISDAHPSAEPFWINLVFNDFDAAVHISYKNIETPEDLLEYLEDGRNFVNKHIPKATSFQERNYVDDEKNVYGTLFDIQGKEAASPMQFFITDSTKHFLRASLYFNTTPNNDSLAPVIDFLKEDITVMMESFKWKEF